MASIFQANIDKMEEEKKIQQEIRARKSVKIAEPSSVKNTDRAK